MLAYAARHVGIADPREDVLPCVWGSIGLIADYPWSVRYEDVKLQPR